MINEPIPLEHVRAVSDAQRLAILRRLMGGPATLSQLGEYFDETAAHVRHHLKVLEGAGLVELCEVRPVRGFLEKYYRATPYALRIHYTFIPDDQRILAIATQDYALTCLAGELAEQQPGLLPLIFPFSSLDGLIALRQGVCQMATTHLLDPESGGYNTPYLRRLFPGQAVVLVHLYRREGGLLLPRGNPQGLRGVADLAGAGVILAQRDHGSGVRVWLDQELSRLGIAGDRVQCSPEVARTHAEAAQQVAAGTATAAVGIRPSAVEHGLEFIPLYEEPYELAMLEHEYRAARSAPFLEAITSGKFRKLLQNSDLFSGYYGLEDLGRVQIILE